MKKAKMIGKKTLSVFLAVMMVLTAWVFVAPTEASAANGSYYYRVKINTTNECDGWNNNNLVLRYKANNGRASSESSTTLFTNNYSYFNATGDHTVSSTTVGGFPTGLTFTYSWGGGMTWRGLTFTITLEASSNGSTWTTIMTQSFDESSSAFSAAAGTKTWNVGGDKYPYVASSKTPSATTAVADIGIPPLGDNQDVSISTRSIQYYSTDQYGVRYEPTSYTITGVEGLTLGSSWSMGSAYEIKATTSTTKSTTATYQTATATLNWENSNYTGTATQEPDSEYTFKVYNPRYKITFNGNGGTLGTGYTWGYYYRPINHSTSVATSNNVEGLSADLFPTAGIKEGHTFKGIYTASSGGSQVYGTTTITGTKTYYAQWTVNQYTANFYGTKANDTNSGTMEYLIGSSTVDYGTLPTAPTVPDYSFGDYDYTFAAWDKEIAAIGVDGAEYRATYTPTFVPADYDTVDAIVAEAEAIINGENYEAIYSEDSRLALENAVNSVIYNQGRTNQIVVDSYVTTIREAIDGLGRQKYSVIFIDETDNSVIEMRYPVYYGDAITMPANPVKGFDSTYHYEFNSWQPSEDGDDITFVSKNMIIYATFDKIAHTYTETSLESNCTTQAGIKYTCSCGYEYIEYSGSAGTEHDLETEWTIDIEPTCTSTGSKSYHCIRCSYRDSVTEISALGHDYTGVDYITVIEPGCENDGAEERECTRCGYNDYNIIPQIGHSWTEAVIAPTCTSSGYTIKTCENCDDEDVVSFTSPTAHTYVENTDEYVAPTCTGLGKKVSYCSCGAQKVETVDMAGHTWNADPTVDFEATCTTKGQESSHCSVCDIVNAESITEIPEKGHSWSEEFCEQKESCGIKGIYVKTCTVCGEDRARIVDALTHNYTVTETVAATCTTKGYTVETCGNCGDAEYTNVVDVLGHDWTEWAVTKEATNTENGILSRSCKNGCGKTETAEIPAGGHTFDVDNPTATTEGTCEKKGTKTFKCTAHDSCGIEITVETELGAHDWTEWTKVDATNENNGSWTRKCNVCQDEEELIIPAGGHTFGDTPTSTVPASCDKTGTATYECTAHDNCGVTITVVLQKTQHTAGTEKKDATCTENGYVKTYCTNCGDVISNVVLDKTGHVETTTERKESTCIEKGYEKVICKCGETVSEKELPLIAHNYDKNGDGKVDKSDAVYADGKHTYTCQTAGCNHTITEDADDTYRVRFFDASGNQIGETQTVKYGEGAVAPETPSKAADSDYHYEFSTWDRNFASITSDLDVYPTYEKEAHFGGVASCGEKALCEKCNTPYGAFDETKHVMTSVSTPATCENNGVINYYCTFNCGYGYSEEIQKLNHNYGEWTVIQQGTCETPHIQQRKCTNYDCNATEEYSTYKAHSWILESAIAPTCTTVGYTEFKYCTVCNLQIDRVEVAKLSHNDLDGNGYCDYCGTSQGVPKCNCMCHSTGFMKIVYSIVRFFWIITRSSPSCSCGASHY